MSDINSFAFTGRLSKDAMFKQLPSGKSVLEMSIANNIGYGNYASTNWLKVKMWGERGANIAPILTKGTLVGGSGELTTETWTDKEGSQHTELAVTVMNIQILSNKSQSSSSPSGEVSNVDDESIPF